MLTDVEMMRLLDHRVGGPPMSRENVVHVGLHVGGAIDLATASGFTEPSAIDNYVRAPVANDDVTWTASAKLVSGPYQGAIAKYNAIEIIFSEATGAWGTPTHVGLFAASTGGSPFALGIITAGSVVVESGALVRFQPGGLMLFLRRAE